MTDSKDTEKREYNKSLYGDEITEKLKESIIEDIKKESSSALVGREQIAKYFDPTMSKSRIHYFFKKHGAELRDSLITYKLRSGYPPQVRICAFPENLRKWARKKAEKGEIL